MKQLIYWLIGRGKLKHFVYWLIQLRKFKQAEKPALIASEQGNEEAARLAMSRAIAIERLLSRIAEQVAQSEKVVFITQEIWEGDRFSTSLPKPVVAEPKGADLPATWLHPAK